MIVQVLMRPMKEKELSAELVCSRCQNTKADRLTILPQEAGVFGGYQILLCSKCWDEIFEGWGEEKSN